MPKKKKVKKTERRETGYGARLLMRIFLGVILILFALFIKQNAPRLLEPGRQILSEWTIMWHEKEV